LKKRRRIPGGDLKPGDVYEITGDVALEAVYSPYACLPRIVPADDSTFPLKRKIERGSLILFIGWHQIYGGVWLAQDGTLVRVTGGTWIRCYIRKLPGRLSKKRSAL
jgi:hypothetical protein